MGLLFNVEVRWLSRGKFWSGCVISTATRVTVFLAEQRHLKSTNFRDNFWLAQVSFLLEQKLVEFVVASKSFLRLPVRFRRFWVTLLSIHEYRHLSQKPISVLVYIPTIYFCEHGFSALVENESKNRKSIKEVDFLWEEPLKGYNHIFHNRRMKFSTSSHN